MAHKSRELSGALASLTAAALALPAFSARAGVRDEASSVSLRASAYTEAEVPAEQRSGADGDRYDIYAFQARAATPVFERWRVSGDLVYETMSGASPWYVMPDPAAADPARARPIQVMSGASKIRDERVDASMNWRYFAPDGEVGFVVGYSTEDDYDALNLGWDSVVDLASQTALNAGVSISDDHLKPTQSRQNPPSVLDADKRSATAVLGLTQVLGPRAVAQIALSGTRHQGYLSDPYKKAFVQSADPQLVDDRRPDVRDELATTVRLRLRASPLNASLHFDYRFFHDSWKIESHTADLAWYQEFGDLWVVPSLRWYSQSQAFFYRPYYVAERADGYYSSDYRLSPYGAITYGLKFQFRVGGQSMSLAVEHYDSDADYAIHDVDVPNPGLVDFTLGTIGYDLKI